MGFMTCISLGVGGEMPLPCVSSYLRIFVVIWECVIWDAEPVIILTLFDIGGGGGMMLPPT